MRAESGVAEGLQRHWTTRDEAREKAKNKLKGGSGYEKESPSNHLPEGMDASLSSTQRSLYKSQKKQEQERKYGSKKKKNETKHSTACRGMYITDMNEHEFAIAKEAKECNNNNNNSNKKNTSDNRKRERQSPFFPC